MKCAEVRNLLHHKIDGELSEKQNRGVDTHLAQCAACKAEYGMLSFPQQVAKTMIPVKPSPFFYQQLSARIEAEIQGVAIWQTFSRLARQMIPALAGITLALISVFAYHQIRGPQENLYESYTRILIAEELPYHMIVSDQGEITNESVLSAIAERQSGHQRTMELK
jgi:hypothetical protein